MYSVVGHHSYGRSDRRHQNRQQQAQNQSQLSHSHSSSQSQLQTGSNFSITSSKRRNNRNNRHRESLTLRFINYLRKRFNPVVGEFNNYRLNVPICCFNLVTFYYFCFTQVSSASHADVI